MRLAATLLLLLITPSVVQGDRVWFGDNTDLHVIDGQDYDAHNIFVVNGTTLTLQNGTIVAPDDGGDGESAVRVDDANFVGVQGKISGGLGVGGTGVTVSTTRDSEYPPGSSTFKAGMEVYGGDATRERTTKGGDAVQVLQAGSKAIFNGGKFTPGTGCTIKACGTVTSDGNSLQVVEGEAVIKGGSFEGVFYNAGGDIEVHGCVEYDKEATKITGVLLDGSSIDVVYKGSGKPNIIYHQEVCPPQQPQQPTPTQENGVGKSMIHVALRNLCVAVFVMQL